jgi:hypothetical protein
LYLGGHLADVAVKQFSGKGGDPPIYTPH